MKQRTQNARVNLAKYLYKILVGSYRVSAVPQMGDYQQILYLWRQVVITDNCVYYFAILPAWLKVWV